MISTEDPQERRYRVHDETSAVFGPPLDLRRNVSKQLTLLAAVY